MCVLAVLMYAFAVVSPDVLAELAALVVAGAAGQPERFEEQQDAGGVKDGGAGAAEEAEASGNAEAPPARFAPLTLLPPGTAEAELKRVIAEDAKQDHSMVINSVFMERALEHQLMASHAASERAAPISAAPAAPLNARQKP